MVVGVIIGGRRQLTLDIVIDMHIPKALTIRAVLIPVHDDTSIFAIFAKCASHVTSLLADTTISVARPTSVSHWIRVGLSVPLLVFLWVGISLFRLFVGFIRSVLNICRLRAFVVPFLNGWRESFLLLRV